MRIGRKVVNTIKSCDTSLCNKKEKEGMVAVQISKQKKLSGRRYREWVKSLVEPKGSDPSIQKERLLSQIDVNTTEPKDSSANGTTDSDSSESPSKPVRLDFQLRRIRDSYDAKRRNSPYLANQTEVQKISILEKFEHPFGEENKSTTTDFVEYWVPVRLSNIQTEQYCGSLFSNSAVLCSSYSWDPMKFLHEILVSIKKCCDHPYLVDWSLHTSLIKGIPQPKQLDAQIKLSSKLLLLLKALLEIKKRGLRVLILYQSLGGSGPITTGDILDDIIHEKFGEDSFVLIDGNISRSKRRADLKTFNEKKGGKFVCLMETRASIPSTELKSIDTVIIFNSDWDPTNDLKALQKMSLDSQFEHVKVFRLYSAHTVEEKVLMLTKNGTTPEGGVRNMKRSTCRELLAWGAYYLFQKLEDFHAISTTDTDLIDSNGDSFVEEVFQELSIILPNNDTSDVHTKSSLILEVKQIEGVYSTNMFLVGEAEYPLMDNYSIIEEMLIKEPPYVFWINILEGRNPSWKYFSCQSPRTRNSAQNLDDLPEECDRPSKKCRTEAGTTACQTPTIRRRRRRRTSGFSKSLDDVPEECGRPSEKCRTEAGTTACRTPRIRRRRRRRTSGFSKSLDVVPAECGRPSEKCRTEAGTTACQTPTIRRGRRCRTSGEAAAASGMQTSILDKPPSLELQSQLPLDDHDQLLPSPTEAQNENHLESFFEYCTREAPPQNTQRAANTAEDARARETFQATHFEVLGTVCKALQTEMERLETQKTEFSKQHEDMKLQTRMAYEKEVDAIHKKYEAMLQDAHTTFLKEQQVLDTRYNKVRVNKALAEALMQRDSNNASPSQAAIKFSVEQAIRLISQSPEPTTEARAERVPVAPARAEGGCLRAPAPHLRHSLPCAFPEMPLPSEPPRITFSTVSLEQEMSSPLPALLPP